MSFTNSKFSYVGEDLGSMIVLQCTKEQRPLIEVAAVLSDAVAARCHQT
jgi:hypothetical protein